MSTFRRNAVILLASSALTSLLGFAFWVIAEHLYPTDLVGRASTIITAATMLGGFSALALGSMYERFLTSAGNRSRTSVIAGLSLTATVALILGTCFALIDPVPSLWPSPVERWSFPLVVLAFALYALADPILVALREAGLVAAKNLSVSIVKLAILPAVTALGAVGIYASWTIVAALTAGMACIWVVRRGVTPIMSTSASLPTKRVLLAHHRAVFSLMVMGLVTPTLIPLMVARELGFESAAYFNVAAIMVTSTAMLDTAIASSYISDAGHPDTDAARVTRQLIRAKLLTAALNIVALGVVGPILLEVVGSDYAAAASNYLRLMCVATLAQLFIGFYALLCRMESRLSLLTRVQAASVIAIVVGSWWAIRRWELTGVGVVFTVVELIAAIVVALPCGAMLRRIMRRRSTPSGLFDAPERVVLALDDIRSVGGVERIVLDLADAFAADGRRVCLLSLGGPGPISLSSSQRFDDRCDIEAPDDLLYVPINAWQRFKLRVRGAHSALRAFDLATERVASHVGSGDMVIAMQLRSAEYLITAGIDRERLIVQYHDSFEAALGHDLARLRRIAPHAAQLLCLNAADAEDFRAAGLAGMQHIANPINLNRLPSGPADCSGRKQVILAAGRLVEQKDHRTLIHAWGSVAGQHPGWRLVIHGDGPLREDLQQLADAVPGDISILPSVDDLPGELRGASVHALSSRHEGMGLVIAEAAGTGTPTVATDGGPGVRELVEDDHTGLLVPVGDAPALAAALNRLISDPSLRRRLGQAAYEHITNRAASDPIAAWNVVLARMEAHVSQSTSH